MAFFGKGKIDFSRPNDSAEDWQAGDIAECISSGRWILGSNNAKPAAGPKHRQRLKVKRVIIDYHPLVGRVQWLRFEGFGSDQFHAASFRKIRPKSDEAIAADAAFIERIGKPPALKPTPTRELEEVSR